METENALELLCKYRRQLMGIAIVWVVFFHSNITCTRTFPLFLKLSGYGGVDIFFFLSGIGLYYSLEKNDNIISFYKRRVWRLAPSYLIFLALWFVKIFREQPHIYGVYYTGKTFLQNLSMLGWMNGLDNQFNWYIQAIFWFYLLAPILFQLIQTIDKKRNPVWSYMGLAFFIGCVEITFWHKETLMAVSRIPIFLMGMLFTDLVRNERWKKIHPIFWYIIAFVACLVLWYFEKTDQDFCWQYGMWWHPFVAIVPGLCLAICQLLEALNSIKCIKLFYKILGIFGMYSFEIYLVHIAFFARVPLIVMPQNNKQWFLLVVSAVVVGILYGLIIDKGKGLVHARIVDMQHHVTCDSTELEAGGQS